MGVTGTPRFKDETGNVYGKLSVLNFLGTNKATSFWHCLCLCGNTIITRGNILRSGKSTSCGQCNREIVNAESVFKRKWRSLKSAAKSRDLSVSISYEKFKELSVLPCHYCNDEPRANSIDSRRVDSTGNNIQAFANLNGIDRLDSDFGYDLNNVVACCAMCNRMKSDFTYDNFYRKINQIYEHRKTTCNS